MCWGTLKGENQNSVNNLQFWVMSFDEKNFTDIYFWEPMGGKKYTLKNRVQYPDLLKKYFKGEFKIEEDVFKELKKKRKKKNETDDKKSNLLYNSSR
jgi:hypothetical protein